MNQLRFLKELIRLTFRREVLPEGSIIAASEKERRRPFLKTLFEPEFLPQDPLLQKKGKDFGYLLFGREVLPEDSTITTPGEERRRPILGTLFEPEILPQDPPLTNKGKGFVRSVLQRETLSQGPQEC